MIVARHATLKQQQQKCRLCGSFDVFTLPNGMISKPLNYVSWTGHRHVRVYVACKYALYPIRSTPQNTCLVFILFSSTLVQCVIKSHTHTNIPRIYTNKTRCNKYVLKLYNTTQFIRIVAHITPTKLVQRVIHETHKGFTESIRICCMQRKPRIFFFFAAEQFWIQYTSHLANLANLTNVENLTNCLHIGDIPYYSTFLLPATFLICPPSNCKSFE